MQRFATELTRALDSLVVSLAPPRPLIRLLLPPDAARLDGLRHIDQQFVGKLKGHLWEQFELPRYARNCVLVNLTASAPVLTRAPQLLVIHDAAILDNPTNFSRAYRTAYRLLWRLLQAGQVHIHTISTFSAQRLAAHGVRTAPARIPNGSDHISAVAADESIFSRFPQIKRGRYVLCIGNRSRNKNFGVVAKALQGVPELQLVVCGPSNSRIFGTPDGMPGMRSIDVSFPSDAELVALYRNAFAFVFPSLYEGFGVPPLEAMRLDCPVIASNTGAIPEVCGDGAIYFKPSSSFELSTILRSLLDDATLRCVQVEKGRKAAAEFRWERSAQTLFEALHQFAADRGKHA
jgi:glycosyltransferase involved in cell wall biosynthesis